MASSLVDLVKINITSTGTGPLKLGSAVTGFRGTDALINGRDYSYSIQQGSAWEVGRGTWLSASSQLVRQVLYSSNGGVAIALKNGAQVSFVPVSVDLDSVQLTADARAAALDAQAYSELSQADALQVSSDRAFVGSAVQTVVSGMSIYDNAYASTLPKGVTSVSIGGTAITGATVGTYPLTFSGGSITGMVANLVVTSATTARVDIINTGLGSGTTPPTVTIPTGATLPAGTTLTAVVGAIIANQQKYWAVSSDGSQFLLCGNNAGSFGSAPFGGTQVTSPSGAWLASTFARSQNAIPFATWSALASATGMLAGDRARVRASDTGTHTDPVVGGTVSNAGDYTYSASPAGWQRTGDLDSQTASALVAQVSGILAQNSGTVLTISDASKRVVVRVNADGSTELVRLITPKVTAPTIEIGSGGTAFQSSTGNPLAIKDANNHVVFDVDANGLTRMVSGQAVKFSADSVFRKNSFLATTDRKPGAFPAEINHIIYYGQSWAGGFDAIPVINTTQPYDTLMFNLNAQGEGIRQQYSVAQDATALQSFVPAVENQRVGTPEFTTANVGETGAVAMANEIKRLILAENNTAMTDQAFQLLVSYPGEGSKYIEDLADPAGIYMKRVIEQITRGYAIAQAMGKTYAVLCVTWLQGNSAIATPYATQLEAMRAYISTQAQSIVQGQGEVPLITWEQYPSINTDGTTNASARGVYTRYVGAADTYPYIYCSGPSYQYGQVSSSNIHYLPPGMADIGRDFAFAIKRAVIDQTAYEPLRPVSLKRQGKIALVKFNVAAGQLLVDTTQVVAQTNYGFNLYDSGGTLLTIASVTIIGPDTIKIVASTAIPSGATLRYADTGTDATNANKWRGNIRDNLGDLGQRNRWLVAFSYPFSN
ncbi:hypothetical protein AQZ52_10975 [Novosphingobium fuchskuhlense]|uniref:Sialate O-acetylesterase domain-containing protein n=1 Tax=Novosphingobium fuchskuhlense TaxID=1117702 RepID=A0A117UUN7_9SPHN|nr:hypothetical protein [Novosphingobium fuchskuhlense]KUR71186.1 hypothetical protein AQZ52_10975 [Novosphingobium fuchskuhlense]